MSTAPWPISEIEIIGGHCCPRPPAPFGRGPAVVRRLDDPNSIRIAFTLDLGGAAGDVLTPPQWRGLLESFNALALPEPVPARLFAALWVFTVAFGTTLHTCLAQLRERQALLAQHPKSPTLQVARNGREGEEGPFLALVDESRAHPLRLKWRTDAHNDAWKHLQRDDLKHAEREAERAISLPPKPIDEDFALLSLIYSRNDRLARSTGLLALARNSYGEEFGRRVDAARERLRADLPITSAPLMKRETSDPSTSRPEPRRLVALQGSQEKTKR